jgi:internalin A
MSHSRRRHIVLLVVGGIVLAAGLATTFGILYGIDARSRDPITRLGGSVRVASVPYAGLSRWIDRLLPGFSPQEHGFTRDVTIAIDLGQTAADNTTLRLLRGMDHLELVDLSETGVDDAGLVHLEGKSRLWHLSLAETATTDAGLMHLQTLPILRFLMLGRTAVTDGGLKQLALFPSLMSLNLIDTDISDAGLAELKGLSQLRELTLGGNSGVTDEGIRQLAAALPKLNVSVHEFDEKDRSVRCRNFESTQGGPPVDVVVFLGRYSATNDDLSELAGYPDLTSLSLAGSRVTDAGLEHLHSLKKLAWVDLTDTQVTADGIEALKQAFPQLKVVRE